MKYPLLYPTLIALALGNFSHTHAAGLPTLQEVTVSSGAQDLTGIADSASEGTVTAKQLANRPLLRPAEVLETIPGMVVTQHSGDGKANQYFLRGFNLDHGSDFATHLMGMPVNMVSHAHGQGYMDLNFLMPELIGNLKYRKGVYAADDGDFVTAGSARIDYLRQLDTSFVDLGLGQNNYRRLLAAGGQSFGEINLLGAIEVVGNDGPWDQPENLKKNNGMLRLTSGTTANGFSLTGMAYQADWKATEHVPERAITSGEIGRYGALLPNDGGKTHRYSLSGDWAQTNANGASKLNLYVIDYGLNLFSGPSGYISGPQGDQHEQADERTIWGGQASQSWFLGPNWKDTELVAGLQYRHDLISSVGLYATENRQRTKTVREDRIDQSTISVFFDARTQWTHWLRTNLGLRRDQIRAQSNALAGEFNMSNGGTADAGQTSPKLSMVLGPFDLLGQTEFYGNWGYGYHSNDARGATARINPQDGMATDAVPLIVKAKGSEIGMRATPLRGWNSNLSLWQMSLASELVFIGDQGITEPKGASQRHGLEWSNYITPADGWIIDADLALSQALFKQANPDNGGRHVPNAIPLTASLGLTSDNGGPWFGGLRLRYLGAYALEETATQKSTPFWMANLKAGYRFSPKLQLTLDVLNLFNKKANDIEYWGGACTRNETLGGTCNGGIDGRLMHPLEPRTLRVGLRIAY
ncbi:MAG: TonB-dependent receptor [Dechloromonas sp.]|jgi:outer membrane receptor protein involved in Fe transport|uniref:TonB-dependent receptor n=1 Tax=Dechloromonas sp. TaxID=1917218 RepID=UPI0027F89D6B|nr:TonB-dependent receptor [Dechloromonas sp.]MBT9520371.1 TonB-dependent receptor [Dechloromonas sp.]